MLKRGILISFLCILLSFNLLKAQHVSESDFKNRLREKLHGISKKLYTAALEGKINAYYSDSLKMVWDLDARKRLGAKIIMRTDAAGKEIYETTCVNPDSLLPDFSVVFRSDIQKDGSVADRVISVLPLIPIIFMDGRPMNMELFHISAADFSKVLTPGEMELLNLYSILKRAEPYALDRTSQASVISIQYQMEQLGKTGRYAVSGNHFAAVFQDFIIDHLNKNHVFELYKKNQFTLSSDSKPIPYDSFKRRHTMLVRTLIATTGDPDYLIDTAYYSPPQRFDSLVFIRGKQFEMTYLQKNPDEKGYTVYAVAPADLKKWLNPSIYRLIQLVLE